MIDKEKVLQIVKLKGPVIPNQIKKDLGGVETYVISAVLSEYVNKGILKISHTKIGGTPTYYAKGQESKLLGLVQYLNEKDQRTVELLKEKKVLRDKNQEMLIRVSLRNIKDFAKQIDVNVKGEKEAFFRWYLTPMEEAEKLIRSEFSASQVKPTTPSASHVEEKLPKEDKKEDKIPEEKPRPIPELKKEEQKEMAKVTQEFKSSEREGFERKVAEYFEKNDIRVKDQEVLRKNSDMEFDIIVKNVLGDVEYFCKAKNKKKSNDGDLSSAYMKGQMKKLPVLYLTTGELTKKAEDMLKDLKGMIVKRI